MLDINDGDRASVDYLKNAKEFDTGLGVKYRKSVILLSIFSIIYNTAGVVVKGAGLGIVSGTITNPSVIGYALFLALLYNFLVYAFDFWVRHEEYFLLATDQGHQLRYGESLVRYLVTTKIKEYLLKKKIDASLVQFHQFDNKYKNHKFEIHGVDLNKLEDTSKVLKEIGAKGIDDKVIKSRFVYTIPYALSESDLDFLNRHFKYLKLLHFRNFIEYRVPYILAIIAMFSFW